jgi:outer membrane protein TolC
MRNAEIEPGASATHYFQKFLALLLCCTCAAPLTWAQQQRAIAPIRPNAPIFWRPYKATTIPPVRLANSRRIDSLIRAGKLYLTVQDAIALAIENNIDIEVARYTPILDAWNVELYQAGGALPGVPSGSSQVGTVASGQGVQGSQAAAGVSLVTKGKVSTGASNVSITQLGPQTPVLDPVFQESDVFSHSSSPEPSFVQSGVSNLISTTRSYLSSVSQGYLLGGNVTLDYTESYLDQNASSNFLNPSVEPTLSFSLNQNLLQGFGVALNARNITIQENTLKNDPLQFKSAVISVVVDVLDLYYGLVADYEDVRAKQSALKVAQDFYANNKKQVQIGTLAPLDITTAEAQVASSQQALVISETTLQQQQTQLKNVLSRTGVADPRLAEAEIIPVDRIEVPKADELPPLQQLIATAMANRSDIQSEQVNLENTKTSALGTANGVLPVLVGLAGTSNEGLAGVPRPTVIPPTPTQPAHLVNPPPYFVGGLGNATAQIFRRNFPSEHVSEFYRESLRNRSAQADYGIDQLSLRQSELQYQRDVNGVAVDVSNQVIALRQARAQYQAAAHSRVLEQQLLDAEQKKFSLGASTPFNVVTQQRDLATAQSTEIAAQVAYSNARVALGETLGTTLKDNNVTLEQALSGRVSRPSSLPNPLPPAPDKP